MKTESAGKEISIEDEMRLLQKLAKQRKESIEVYRKQGRDDLVKEEADELVVIEQYLPQQMSVEELRKILNKIIEDVGAKIPSDMGKVMPLAMKQLAGRSDGKTISEVIKSILSE
jgi:uncharacterized protein YqeY